MDATKSKYFGVISGDISNSSSLPNNILRNLRSLVFNISSQIHKVFPQSYTLGFSLYRGDSFQALIARPELTPTIALFFRTALRNAVAPHKIDTRIAMGIGTVDNIPPTADDLGYGPAYTRAGRLLPKMKSDIAFKIATPAEELNKEINIILALVNEVAKKWKPGQIAVITELFKYYNQDITQTKIANLLGIKDSSLSTHISSSSFNEIKQAMNFITETLEKIYSD